MARITSKGQLIGAVGPVVYKVVNGKNTLQTKPRKYKQTEATEKAGSDFGRASRLAKYIRKALEPIIAGFETGYMPSRLSGVIYRAARASATQQGAAILDECGVSELIHFQFNTLTPFGDYCRVKPLISYDTDSGLTITIPDFDAAEAFSPVQGAAEAQLCFLVNLIDPEAAADQLRNAETPPTTHIFRFPVLLEAGVIPAQSRNLPDLPKGNLVIVTAAVFYFRRDGIMGAVGLNSKLLHPCEISTALLT